MPQITAQSSRLVCRPPHGGRGLKYNHRFEVGFAVAVALHTEGVD